MIIPAAIMLAPLLLKLDEPATLVCFAFGMISGLQYQQAASEKRFNALVEFLMKEGVLRE